MSHTPEPWIVNGSIRIESEHEHGFVNDGWIIGDLDGPDAKENARRIVACVNACRLIPTEWLEQNGAYAIPTPSMRDTIKERDTYRDLCTELLSALKPYMEKSNWCYDTFNGYINTNSDLITKAESILGEGQ